MDTDNVVAAISCFLYFVFSSCPFLFRMLMYFFTFCILFFLASYVNFVAYIFVLSPHVHLVLVYRPVYF